MTTATNIRNFINRTSNNLKYAQRILLYAVPGWGKTSFGANFKKPLFLMSRGETGLITLAGNSLVPETDYIQPLDAWSDFIDALRMIEAEGSDHSTLVLDVLNGFERLCHEHVCEKLYKGDWGPSGFSAFNKGYESALNELVICQSLLDRIRIKHNITILMLCHSQIRSFEPPFGTPYKVYAPQVHEKTWGVFKGWADIVMFGNFFEDETTRKKNSAKQTRVLYTQQTMAWDAKHRHGLSPEIYLPEGPAAAVQEFRNALIQGHQNNQPKEQENAAA